MYLISVFLLCQCFPLLLPVGQHVLGNIELLDLQPEPGAELLQLFRLPRPLGPALNKTVTKLSKMHYCDFVHYCWIKHETCSAATAILLPNAMLDSYSVSRACRDSRNSSRTFSEVRCKV